MCFGRTELVAALKQVGELAAFQVFVVGGPVLTLAVEHDVRIILGKCTQEALSVA